MAEYVARAREIAAVLAEVEGVRVVPPVPPTNMMHVYLPGDPVTLREAAALMAVETGVTLFTFLADDGKWELTIGEAAEDFTNDEIRRLVAGLLAR
jgi:threonine aldolase